MAHENMLVTVLFFKIVLSGKECQHQENKERYNKEVCITVWHEHLSLDFLVFIWYWTKSSEMKKKILKKQEFIFLVQC